MVWFGLITVHVPLNSSAALQKGSVLWTLYLIYKYKTNCSQWKISHFINHYFQFFTIRFVSTYVSRVLCSGVCWLRFSRKKSSRQCNSRLKYEGRLKSLWTGYSTLLLCIGRHNNITAAHCHQSTNFSNGPRSCSAILKRFLLKWP
jgi:hypothetical protein